MHNENSHDEKLTPAVAYDDVDEDRSSDPFSDPACSDPADVASAVGVDAAMDDVDLIHIDPDLIHRDRSCC